METHGVTDCTESSSSDFIHCDVTVAKAEAMLDTKSVTTLPLVANSETHIDTPQVL